MMMKRLSILCFIMGYNAKNCNLKENLSYSFTECPSMESKTSAFFFYDRMLHCDLRDGKSEVLPSHIEDIPCKQLCSKDGFFKSYKLNNDNKPILQC